MKNSEKIVYLSKDAAFGILTRPALELALSESQYGIATIYVLDLTAIHKLNKALGYRQVNDKLWKIFYEIQTLYPKLIIGRIFSGDEIAIIDPGKAKAFMKAVIPIFSAEGIAFRHLKDKIQMGMTPRHYKDLLDSWTTVLNHNRYYQTL